MRTHLRLQSWLRVPPLLCALCLLLTPLDLLQAQEDPSGSANIPVRVTSNPMAPILGGPQLPPYGNMGIFLNNAFVTPSGDMVLVQDSSVCSTGDPGTSEFDPFLVAMYSVEDGMTHAIDFYKVQQNGDRARFSRKEFSYEDGRLTEYRYSLWETTSAQWNPALRELIGYNAQGHFQDAELQEWTGDAWLPSSRSALGYGPEGTLDTASLYEWQNDQWVQVARITAEYNENRLPTVVQHEESEAGVWETLVRETYGYDAALEFILETYLLEVPNDQGSLAPVLREMYDYNLRGFYSGRTEQVWDEPGDDWLNTQRDQFGYSAIGVWKEWTHQVWDTAWQNDFFREMKLFEDVQVDVHSNWDPLGGDWVNGRRRFVKFDAYGNLRWERNNERWDETSQDWINGANTTQCRHYWSEEMTSSLSYSRENLVECNLMNPYALASEIQCLSLEQNGMYQARLIDQMGRLIFLQAFQGGSSFSIDREIPAGMYYLMIAARDRVMYQRKMVIQN